MTTPSGSATLRAETLALGGAGQIVDDHLEARSRRSSRHSVTSRHGCSSTSSRLRDEDRAPDLRPGAVRALLGGRGTRCRERPLRPRILRTDEAGRWEIFHDVSLGPCSGGRAATSPSGRWSVPGRRGGGPAACVWLLRLPDSSSWGPRRLGVVERNTPAAGARGDGAESRPGRDQMPGHDVGLMLAAEAARTAPATAEDVLRQALTVDRLLHAVPVGGAVTQVAAGSPEAFFVASADGRARRYAGAAGDARRPVVDLEARYRVTGRRSRPGLGRHAEREP